MIHLAPARRFGLTAVLLSVAVTVAACGVTAGSGAGQAAPSGTKPKAGNGDVVGSDVVPTTGTTTPSTTTAPPPTDLAIKGDDGSETNKTVANAIADLQTWWAGQFPAVYGKPYQPVSGGFFAVGPGSSTIGLPCSPDTIDQVLDNAYYCPTDDAVVWDQDGLMPDLAAKYGTFTPAVVLAHEWGHAIQERAQFSAATVISEQQADCFAGAWVKHVKTDDDARFRITTDDLDNALAGFLSLRDAPGSTADDPNAHGSGFDRVRAFQEGFESGVQRCSEYRDGDPKPYQFPFSRTDEVETNGDLPLEGKDGIIDLAFPSLDAYWKAEFPKIAGGKAWDPMGDPRPFGPTTPPTCDGDKIEGYRLFVCFPDRYVAFDDTDTIPATYKDGGDFAVATLFATQYGLDIESQLDEVPSSEVTATLIGDCYAGSWAASILPGVQQPTEDGIVLSPGDLDEAVGVLLQFRSDDDRKRQGPGFDRVHAFGVGVTKGADACPDVRPS
ncbi:MAG: peptidase [Acidimicrobiales bacterium]|nr:peptidase [Acidimicrobiales bacterium]